MSPFTGGCQCGAVRYRIEGEATEVSICNCRMCQKAFGNFFAPLAHFSAPIVWTRGRPSVFRSSQSVARGFCSNCGTPLSYQVDGHEPSISVGSLDRAEDVVPSIEYARENRHPMMEDLSRLVAHELGETDEERNMLAILKSNQHPDHDTDAWPPPACNRVTAMTRERLYLYDTTLRDGAQTAGIEFSLEDKIAITALIEQLGIDYVEGGFPGANTIDTEFFDRRRTRTARFAAFGMAKRSGRSIDNDRAVAGAIGSVSDAVCFVSKSSRPQVEIALGIPPDENLANLAESVVAGAARGKEVLIDAEHFFDGYKADSDYSLRFLETALGKGARWVVLCDTNGGTLPEEVEEIVGELVARFPGDKLGIHAHDDTGQAVANSLAAVRAGARQIQGTLNGIGERCGNANLVTLLPTLVLKPAYADRFETGVTPETLGRLTKVSRAFDDRLNRAPDRHAPYVGASAFATKAGIHASALAKDSSTYEHIPPESVGNERAILVSQQAGRSNLLPALARNGVAVDKDDPRVDILLQAVKDKAAEGYSYEGADASFKLLALRTLGRLPAFFDVESYRASVERRHNARGEQVTVTEAVVKLDVDGQQTMSVAEGNGPVNALDLALRKDLGKYSDRIGDLELVDFKVRILDGGTGAVTRVLVESRDGEGERWFTIGVSPNIIDASFEALYESILYKLLKTEPAAAA